jgi:hypothetical protein
MIGSGPVVIYLFFSILTGLCATPRRVGFFGAFLASIIATPLVVLLVLLATAPADPDYP